MNDEKPLRQEDYLAMAEENRRLREKLAAQGKKKGPKIPRAPREPGAFKKWLSLNGHIFASVFGMLFLVGALSFLGWDCAQESKKPNCYKVAKWNHADRPWDPWHIWQVSTGRYGGERGFIECPGGTEIGNCPGFKKFEDAQKFMTDWKLQGCK